ncbi:acyl-CoA dehydrogenase family protein [Cumulibacter manganitolerans]|uniref:acyl-CoA dehydrogenase family protein n=1 Tax=Cumulibacter manganitolerans TaxID=1884992 RepID=UPI0012959C45|nr:acyl-CoA dehydrogenase family protein [Cumulibacter manganitolerans]
MTIQLTDEHDQLRQYLTRYLSTSYDLEASRDAAKNGAGWQPQVWRDLADRLGVLGAALPIEAGGDGGGAAESLVITEALGRALVVEPYVDTVVLAGTLLHALAGESSYDALAQIASGQAIWAVAGLEPAGGYCFHDVTTTARRDGDGWLLSGAKSIVTTAPIATDLLVIARTDGGRRDRHGLSVFRVSMGESAPAGLVLHRLRTYDDRPAADIALRDVRIGADALIGAEGEAWDAIDLAVDAATAAVCSEAVGCMRKLLDDTVGYTKQREQFGRPIASFQALQHRMVDMYLHVEQASAAAEIAYGALDGTAERRHRAVSAAKVTVARAAKLVGQEAVQLHGGMGMTEELAVGHYFKRLTAVENEYGSVEQHLRRYAGR